MIVKPAQAERFATNPPADLRAALVHGADQGLVRERAETLARSVVEDLADPFGVVELDETQLIQDPARLWDEAAAISMLGGRRVVRVRGAGNGLATLFGRFLADPPGDALVVVEAGELAKSASLRRLFEDADNAAALICYGDSGGNLEDVVREALKAEGFAVEPAAVAEAVARLGSDRGVTRRELEKLALFARGEKTITRAHVMAVMGDEAEVRSEEACDAAGEGDFARLDRALERLWSAGASPGGVLRQAMSHFQRLLAVRAEADEGGPADLAIRRLRPPVHFSRENSFRAQARQWSAPHLAEALDQLYEAEVLCRTTGVPNEEVTGRAFMNVAAMARPG